MELDKDQQKELHEILLSAFPQHMDLEMMVWYGLNKKLSTITSEKNLEYAIFKLIEWCQARGKLEELVLAARNANSENKKLVSFARSQSIEEKEEPPPVRGENVLITSLGESPSVVSIMYDLLTKQEKQQIDKIIVLHPKDVTRSYKLVRKAFKELEDAVQLQCELLDFDDANSYTYVYDFWSRLYKLLTNCQAKNDQVYLSLAGGHKSMSALMAWIAPFFSCVQKLYHVIDKEEEQFPSVDEIELNMTDADCMQVMHPDAKQLARLFLVDIPFRAGQKINPNLHSYLLSATRDELAKMQDEEAENVIVFQKIAQDGSSLKVQMTKRAREQLEALRANSIRTAKQVRTFLDGIARNNANNLRLLSRVESLLFKPAKVQLHLVQLTDTVRCVFYVCPKDIDIDSEAKVEKVVICELEDGQAGEYRTLQEIAASAGFSPMPKCSLEDIPPILYTAPADSVLIVPLGKSPMVATQLYTLLTRQEQRTIRAVILVFPRKATEITTSADLIKDALCREANVPCRYERVIGWEDIVSQKACEAYQQALEVAIDDVRAQYPDCKIDLALSGGRKGMTAMTIFAAQKKKINFVYHTLITDEELERKIERETTIEALEEEFQEDVPDDKLFLRAYEPEGPPYTKFVLFRVPVFAPDEQ